MRMCLEEEFSSIHIINLRGDIRKNMLSKGRAKEGQNIFSSGSMSGISLTIFVKNGENKKEKCNVYYYDIGDDLSTQRKLEQLRDFGSISGIENESLFKLVDLNDHGDWIGRRDDSFERYLPIGAKKDPNENPIFSVYSSGVKTNRDSWCYQSSKRDLKDNISKSISYFNSVSVGKALEGGDTAFKWCQKTLKDKEDGKSYKFDAEKVRIAQYRPFLHQWLYFDSRLNWSKYLTDRFLPTGASENRVIALPGVGARSGFSVFMTAELPDVQLMDNGQCFPLYTYKKADGVDGSQSIQGDLLANPASIISEQDEGITDGGLRFFQTAYPGERISKEDIFYYVYGLLHSEDYRDRFADNLSKELPRIPAVKKVFDFWAFVEAGRKLGDLHCDFEQVEPYPVDFTRGDTSLATPADPESFYRVDQMKFAGKRPNLDKTTVVYNANITMSGIPLEAYDYLVNGKPALEWVMERQCIKTDKKTGIVNDANRYAIETVGDPAYPLRLFQRVITVSLETMKIVRSLPKLDID